MTKVDYNNFDSMQERVGQDGGMGNGVRLPSITVHNDFDPTKPKVTPGLFVVDYEGAKAFFPTFEFRPFLNVYQYRRFSPAVKKVSNRSIIVKNFREEAVDELGGVKCGKLSRKELEALPADKRAELSDGVNVFRIVYGTLSVKAIREDGTSVTINNYPCQMQLKGINFMPIGDLFNTLSKNKKLMYNHVLSVSNERKKNGGVTFYEWKFDVDMNKVVVFKEPDIAILDSFESLIRDLNKVIIERHNYNQNKFAKPAPTHNPADPNDPIDDLLGA